MVATAVVLGAAAIIGVRLAGHTSSGKQAAARQPATASAPAPSSTPAASASTTRRATATGASSRAERAERAARSAAARATIKRLIASAPTGISVAAADLSTGHSYAAGARSGIPTASTYKLLVLETLLLQRQQAGTGLSDAQVAQATSMIENSDNPAGYDLFLAAGGNAGLISALRLFGMNHTVPGGTDPTFTTTSATDCLVLLRNLVKDGPLDSASRSFALGLLHNVQADQRWGVGAAADAGSTFANKNGWLNIDDDGGRWAVNSAGVLTVHQHKLLLAIMTQHNADFQTGVELVESLATATAAVLTG